MKNILIIEDEIGYQKVLKDTLEKEQFTVSLAQDVTVATLEVSKNPPDLILLDIILPGGKNGFDFLERIKSDDRTKKIPVIIITNIPTEEKVSKEIGADFYLVKSETTIEEIIKRVKLLI